MLIHSKTRQTVNTAGNVVTERIWHSPFIWNLSRIESYLGKEYGFSNSNPQAYQLWNTGQWHDDSPSGQPIQYVSVLAMAYQNYRRQGLSYMDKVYLEGYMGPGSKIYLRVLYDYQGSGSIVNAIINSTRSPAKQFIQAVSASLGQTTLGGNPLGTGLPFSNDPQDLIPKFRCIRSIPIDNFFENQLVVYTQDLDAQFEILCLGTDVRVNTEQQATFIINRGQN